VTSAQRSFSNVLFWEFDRGTLAYDLLWLAILLFLALTPPAWLGDPLAVAR
jgi:hypothetical protein